MVCVCVSFQAQKVPFSQRINHKSMTKSPKLLSASRWNPISVIDLMNLWARLKRASVPCWLQPACSTTTRWRCSDTRSLIPAAPCLCWFKSRQTRMTKQRDTKQKVFQNTSLQGASPAPSTHTHTHECAQSSDGRQEKAQQSHTRPTRWAECDHKCICSPGKQISAPSRFH